MKYPFLLYDREKISYFDSNDVIWDKIMEANNGLLCIFLQIPNITKTDILEFFEYAVLEEAESSFEIDEGFLGDFDRYSYEKLDLTLYSNDPKPTYASEYIGVIGELFLANYINFSCYNLKQTLFHYLAYPYLAWKYFRDNFLYNYWNILYNQNKGEEKNWDNLQNLESWDIGVFRTPKGTKYFNEILSPRFYNKYKDLQVEIDFKGNIIRWIGRINR